VEILVEASFTTQSHETEPVLSRSVAELARMTQIPGTNPSRP